MRPLFVVEVNGPDYGSLDLFDVREPHSFQKFVLHRVVDPFRLSVILGVTGLGHADAYVVFLKKPDILGASILAAPV